MTWDSFWTLRGRRKRNVLVEECSAGHVERHFRTRAGHEKASDRKCNDCADDACSARLTSGVHVAFEANVGAVDSYRIDMQMDGTGFAPHAFVANLGQN